MFCKPTKTRKNSDNTTGFDKSKSQELRKSPSLAFNVKLVNCATLRPHRSFPPTPRFGSEWEISHRSRKKGWNQLSHRSRCIWYNCDSASCLDWCWP